jgi:archaellin
VILGGSSSSAYGAIVGGDSFQDGYNQIDLQRNTIVLTGGSATKLSSYSTGITSSTFKNNIFVGNGNSETLGFTPLIYKNNCLNNTGETSGGTDNLFETDPQFVDSTNADYRLRPSSPCINAGTAS